MTKRILHVVGGWDSTAREKQPEYAVCSISHGNSKWRKSDSMIRVNHWLVHICSVIEKRYGLIDVAVFSSNLQKVRGKAFHHPFESKVHIRVKSMF
ncbi:hypothetical protein TrCOL_g10504 [Triparma columacea]|uniref:Uncharacterized protein n=1 Tax=Triparma columacea TaxID=722753 RepID=A0A9W7GN17_9STRA|nr:hypothetical protein TrCOL_g10504 [Triparma columacea]